MIEHRIIYQRPNIETLWFHIFNRGKQPVLTEARKVNFIDTGLLLNEWREISEDYLTCTHYMQFQDQAALDQYQSNSSINELWALITNYCDSVSITYATETVSK